MPCLFHVHCGHYNEIPQEREMRFYKDIPDSQNWDDQQFQQALSSGFNHLRNGYYRIFGTLFDNILEYSKKLRQERGISFPQNNLRSRFEFYKLLVRFVAGTLSVSGVHQGVNDILSAIAFNQDGLIINEQLKLQASPPGSFADLESYF
jgi:hypothetical protein